MAKPCAAPSTPSTKRCALIPTTPPGCEGEQVPDGIVITMYYRDHPPPHFHAIYAYCRWSDDLSDETAGGDEALRLLAELGAPIAAAARASCCAWQRRIEADGLVF